jgi:hypothetical protein
VYAPHPNHGKLNRTSKDPAESLQGSCMYTGICCIQKVREELAIGVDIDWGFLFSGK